MNLFNKVKQKPRWTYTESLKEAGVKALAEASRTGAIDMQIVEITPRTFKIHPVDWKSERKGKRKVWRVRFQLLFKRLDGSEYWVHQTLNADRYLTREV